MHCITTQIDCSCYILLGSLHSQPTSVILLISFRLKISLIEVRHAIMDESCIKLITRNDLSLLYRCLRRVIRPLRPRLVKPGKPLPAGSPKLKRPKSKCRIEERLFQGLYLYDFHPLGHGPDRNTKRLTQHKVFYFAGGGFQSPPSSGHWKLCADISNQLRDTHQITLVSYPLAPSSPASESLPTLQTWLEAEASAAASDNRRITLMGDSAGGNVVLSLSFWWASKQPGRSSLINAFVISPATDLRNDNPEIAEADKHDPVLSVSLTTEVAKKWAAHLPRDSPELSPNLADFNVLQQSKVKVHGVVGTHDVLAPDAIIFRELCAKYKIPGEWLQWEGQMHCFPIASVYGLPEGKVGRDWILDVLRRNI